MQDQDVFQSWPRKRRIIQLQWWPKSVTVVVEHELGENTIAWLYWKNNRIPNVMEPVPWFWKKRKMIF